jgi:dihydrodipicolinate synthase/N-acetylneuraminate lyase
LISAAHAIHGVLPVVQLPYARTGDVDLETLHREIDWVLGQGADGVTTGMVTELLRLTTAERLEVAEAVCGAAKGRSKLAVVSCGAESTKGAVDFARHAAACRADAVMAIPPVTVALTDDALWGYYAEIIERSGLPLVVQDASGYVGQPISTDLQVKLLATYGDLVYFKPEAQPIGPRLSALRDATGGRARIFEGSGGSQLVDSFRRGIVGTMPGAEVCWAVCALWRALERRDWSAAYAMSGPLTSLVSLQHGIDGFVAVEKHLLVRQGVFQAADVRGPSAFTLDGETAAEVDRLFDALRHVVSHDAQTQGVPRALEAADRIRPLQPAEPRGSERMEC